MSNKVNGLWAVNSSSVFMFFDSVNTPSVWRFEMKDGVESWRMIPGVKNAQAVRGVAAAYRADGGTWLDPNGSDYAQAVREIGRRPALLTAYLSTVINAAADNLPDPRHMDCLF